MAAVNQAEFDDHKAIYLTAGGWDEQGRRSGGIIHPKEQLFRPGDILMRAYHPTHKIGQWWATPEEVVAIGNHFARSSEAFAIGRADGQSILHAVFAVRHEWGHKDVKHLHRFVAIRLIQPIKTMVGEGGDAPSEDWSHLQKAFRIDDGRGGQRRVQQIFVPNLYRYESAFTELVADAEVDKSFLETAAKFAKVS